MRTTGDFTSLKSVIKPLHLAIGVFDGLHRGHQAVIQTAVTAAKASEGEAWLVTFKPHPLALLRPEAAPLRLMGDTLRQIVLAEMGLSGVLELPFTTEFAAQTGEAFCELLLKHAPTLRSISVGEDWHFGKGRDGNVQLLTAYGKKNGFCVNGITPVLEGETVVSSTWIRGTIQSGNLQEATRLLGRPFSMAGRVVEGRKLARKLGFPTANVSLEAECLPPLGVYAVHGRIWDGATAHPWWPGVANLGVRPTVEAAGTKPSLEVHFFDLQQDLYGKVLEVRLREFIRPEKRLQSLEELKEQIAKDSAEARRITT